MNTRILKHSLVLALPAFLNGCGYWDAREAHRAQYEMAGMSSFDLQSCAGAPSSTSKLNDTTQVWQYNISRSFPAMQDNGFFPVGSAIKIYQSFFGGAGSSCKMFVRMDHDRVSEVHYAGDDDGYIGVDGVCSMITRGCARQRESTMHRAPGIFPFGPISAFHSAPTPPQSTTATYSDQSSKYVPNFDGDPTKPLIRPASPTK
ncbi:MULTISPECIES: hypothetical protein [unclassified Saccharibacter]|uniref:hypothetical protein n=1 Tax=unclassified Saccharibacter TaxID=2648722 RepID=UPI00132BD847|nr:MULTISPECIES: hypothetical protein [unclassified Saccharibacter]MXV35921.1 hypothetical protein [Saccharibacter sp. EH611]MXV58041.1 hypothetical protein [Saccharibacter sp. EH70]MXV66279.1 hypothetical protein [Saccharibacter sp. EH60]